MLELRIDNKPFDLQAKSAMNLRLQNPALDTESLGRAYSYPFRVPHSPRNLRNLQHRHRLDATQNLQFESAEVRLAGVPFLQGRAKTEEHSNEQTEVTFQNNDLSSLEALDEIEIRSLVGTVAIPQLLDAEIVLTPGAGPVYQFYINDKLYQAGGLGVPKIDAMIELVGEINADYPGVAFYSNIADTLTLTYQEEDFVVQYLNTNYTLESQRTLAQAREYNIQAFIAGAQTTPRADMAFPVSYERQHYGSLNQRWSGYFNYRLGGNFENNPHFEAPYFRYSYKPLVRLRYILDLIATEAGITDIVWDVPTALQEDLEDLLIYNNYALDDVLFEQVLEENANLYMLAPHTEINLANHIPDYTAKELLQRLAQFFNMHFRFQDNRLYFRRNLDQLSAGPQDWTRYTDPNYDRTATEGGGVTLQFEADIDEPFEDQGDPEVVADGSNPITLPAAPVYYREINNTFADPSGIWTVATIEQRGSSPAYELENEQETLRLLFENGSDFDSEDREYEKATPIGKAFDLIFITEDRSLYDTWWKGWTDFLFSPVITRLCWLPISEVLRLSTWEKAFVKIYHPDGECLALIRSAQIRAGTDGISAAKIEFQRKM